VDLKTAQTRLGHSDPRLTLAVYAQATTEGDRVAAERLASASLVFPNVYEWPARKSRLLQSYVPFQPALCSRSKVGAKG